MNKIYYTKTDRVYIIKNGKRVYIDNVYYDKQGFFWCIASGYKIELNENDLTMVNATKINQYEFMVELGDGVCVFITAENEKQIKDFCTDRLGIDIARIKRLAPDNENTVSLPEQFANYEIYLPELCPRIFDEFDRKDGE